MDVDEQSMFHLVASGCFYIYVLPSLITVVVSDNPMVDRDKIFVS